MEIAIIDRHPIIRKGLEEVLKSHFKEAILLESESVQEFQEKYPGKVLNLAIIGVSRSMIENDLSFINMAKRWYPKSSIIIYDEEYNLHMISQYLNSGVSGYLSKAAGINELIDCITKVISGKKYLSEEALLWVLNTYAFEKKSGGNPKSPKMDLTRREFEIAGYLADGMKTSWIASKLGRRPSTISTIKINIFKKLKVNNVVDLRTAVQPLR